MHTLDSVFACRENQCSHRTNIHPARSRISTWPWRGSNATKHHGMRERRGGHNIIVRSGLRPKDTHQGGNSLLASPVSTSFSALVPGTIAEIKSIPKVQLGNQPGQLQSANLHYAGHIKKKSIATSNYVVQEFHPLCGTCCPCYGFLPAQQGM